MRFTFRKARNFALSKEKKTIESNFKRQKRQVSEGISYKVYFSIRY